jgi:hypothetical protein
VFPFQINNKINKVTKNMSKLENMEEPLLIFESELEVLKRETDKYELKRKDREPSSIDFTSLVKNVT